MKSLKGTEDKPLNWKLNESEDFYMNIEEIKEKTKGWKGETKGWIDFLIARIEELTQPCDPCDNHETSRKNMEEFFSKQEEGRRVIYQPVPKYRQVNIPQLGRN